jgi:hypothetical protein
MKTLYALMIIVNGHAEHPTDYIDAYTTSNQCVNVANEMSRQPYFLKLHAVWGCVEIRVRS